MWMSHHLDTVIYEGDSLYQTIVRSRFQGNACMLLCHDDLPNTFSAFGIDYDQHILSTSFGVVDNHPAISEASQTLEENIL